MKKITIMLLVAMIPFLTMAQKRSKKKEKQAVEQIKSSKATVEYMVIKGVEIPMDIQGVDIIENSKDISDGEDVRSEIEIKRLLKPQVRLIIAFDFGNERTKEVSEMMRASSRFRSMSAAANAAAVNGWEFVSANIVNGKAGITHYYYMKRNK
ncbi:MAG: hypothetical protein HN522_00075 [Flavobacteriales bacterium]|jgi:hypothetical protein|nr:hypothetical protein [Flavobacteriales bacterium]MBT5090730.1 hypothetical protein [Flavobacteriales bacterium]